jgi:hypothetical protein
LRSPTPIFALKCKLNIAKSKTQQDVIVDNQLVTKYMNKKVVTIFGQFKNKQYLCIAFERDRVNILPFPPKGAKIESLIRFLFFALKTKMVKKY